MIEFSVAGVEVQRYAATPGLAIRVGITESSGDTVHAAALRCQLRIDPQRRAYDDAEAAGLVDLFGDRSRWSGTLRPFLWAHTSTMVHGFTGATEVALPVPLTYDLEVAAAKYLHAVRDGDIPISLMFAGTVFLRGDDGFQVRQIPWDADLSYRMPARLWREAMDEFFPGAGWIRLHRDTIDALVRAKSALGLPGWDDTFTTLLARAGVAP